MDLIPERALRAAMVLRELYSGVPAGLPAERMAKAYLLVPPGAEDRANALISRWLDEAYNQGQEDAEYAHQRARQRDMEDFMATARTVTKVVETGVARDLAEVANRRGEGEDHPGGAVPVWCGPLCPGRCEEPQGLCPYGDRVS